MPDPDTISADYTLRPSELASTLKILVEARQPVMVWGGPGMRQERGGAAGRRRGRPHLLRRARPAARPRRPARHPLARQRQPHPLGAPRLPAAHRQHRPLPRQPGGASLPACRWCRRHCSSSSATASAASTSSPKAPRSWPAATARATAASPTACRRRWHPASSTSRSRSTRRTGANGEPPTGLRPRLSSSSSSGRSS